MMKYRQYILAAVLGVLLLSFGGEKLWLMVTKPISDGQAKIDRVNGEIEKQRQEFTRGRKEAKELKVYEAQSLPSDPEMARSLYQAWLVELVGHVGLISPSVDSGQAAGRKGLYQSIAFSARGRGTLEQLIQFLFEFYRAGHLHQIRSLSITPLGNTGQLDLSISIDALILPTADRADRLSSAVSDRLAYGSLDDYRVIVRRNLFGVGGAADPLDLTYLTAVNHVDGVAEVWFSSRTTEKLVKAGQTQTKPDSSAEAGNSQGGTLKLRRGETLRVGPFTATIVEIDEEDVIFECDGQRWLMTVGESLAEATALPPGM
jgi:hypothetical protein